jgi:hypothetical protein
MVNYKSFELDNKNGERFDLLPTLCFKGFFLYKLVIYFISFTYIYKSPLLLLSYFAGKISPLKLINREFLVQISI